MKTYILYTEKAVCEALRDNMKVFYRGSRGRIAVVKRDIKGLFHLYDSATNREIGWPEGSSYDYYSSFMSTFYVEITN